jgi:SPP1 phage holin
VFDLDKGTFIRTAILIIALLNQLLVSFGLNPIPGDEDTWYERLYQPSSQPLQQSLYGSRITM